MPSFVAARKGDFNTETTENTEKTKKRERVLAFFFCCLFVLCVGLFFACGHGAAL